MTDTLFLFVSICSYKYRSSVLKWGNAAAYLVEALQAGRLRVRFPMVSLDFFY